MAPQIQQKKSRPQKIRLWCEKLKIGKKLKHYGICHSTDYDWYHCNYSSSFISGQSIKDQNNQSNSKSKSSEFDNTISEFLDWKSFLKKDWNRFSNLEDISKISSSLGNNCLHIMTV